VLWDDDEEDDADDDDGADQSAYKELLQCDLSLDSGWVIERNLLLLQRHWK
jgi:hypothetical protein